MTVSAPTALGTAVIAAVLASPRPSLAGDPPVEPLAVSRETTWITEPLGADGTPDYTAWLARRHGADVTPENNAASVLQIRLVGRVGDLAPLEKELKTKIDAAAFAAQHRRALLGPWREAEAPLIAAWLRVNEPWLDLAEQIVRTRPRLWIPPPADMGWDTRMPSRLGARGIVEAFRARAFQHAAKGGSDGARRDLIIGLRLGALLDQGITLIDRIIGVGLRAIAAQPVVALANPPLDRVTAAALLEDLRSVSPSRPLEEVLEITERLQFLAGYMDLYRNARGTPEMWQERLSAVLATHDSANAALGQKAFPPNLRRVPPWAIDWNELLRRVNECWLDPGCEAGFAAARRDLESPSFDRLVDRARTDPEARRRVARAFMTLQTPSSLLRTAIFWNEERAVFRTGLVGAAAALWHVDHGRYPHSAADLAFGPASPGFDPASDHAGYAFHYRVSSDGRRFVYTGAPLLPGESGIRRFCGDSSGRLALADGGTAPMVADGLCAPGTETLAARTVAP